MCKAPGSNGTAGGGVAAEGGGARADHAGQTGSNREVWFMVY